jgi:hypothetical protein
VNECSALKALNAEALKCRRAEMLKLAVLFVNTAMYVFRLSFILLRYEDAYHGQTSVVLWR